MKSSLVCGVTERWLLDQRRVTFEKSANLMYIAVEAIIREVNM